jgi:hypothetical protein
MSGLAAQMRKPRPYSSLRELLWVNEMAGPRFEDDSLPVRAAVFASGRTALMSTINVSTPDHLWRAFNASCIPAPGRPNQVVFARGITNAGVI